ncbi:MAG: CHASE2 domain-containing protein [Proteobacteria bacterium]|nr:CHASE2 domain-containing protein [Pseudomonadota bacterium]
MAIKPRDLLVALAVGTLATSLTLVAGGEVLRGLSIDTLTWLRHAAYGPLHPASSSHTAVIAIDEETYRTAPFAGLPKALWTPQMAKVLNSVVGAGAVAVGFDAIVSESVEPLLRGYDREFLLALRDASRDGRVVLGKVQHSQLPIAPSPGQSFAVGHEKNIRSVNLIGDNDDVIRRAPLSFTVEDRQSGTRREPSFSAELAARAARAPISWHDGAAWLGDWRIPARDDNLLLNFSGGGTDIPVYALHDVYACAAADKPDVLRAAFAGKVVLLGVVLDVEDRKPTSSRWVTGPEGAGNQPRCATEPLAALQGPPVVRETIPGVFIHATAINNLLRHEPLHDLSPTTDAAITDGFGIAAATVSALAPLGPAGAALAIGLVVYVGLAIVVFHDGLVLPLLAPALVAVLSFAVMLVYRIAIADRDKRLIRKMFGLYLAPEMVDTMIKSDRLPVLGGERREMSFMFTDVAGFTTMAERMDPSVLAPILNSYLDGACEVIKQHGGMVNEFIGDAILAFFGAPQNQPDHAARAVACAHALDRYAEAFRQRQQADDVPFGRTRIGVHTGTVFVGNVGSAEVKMKYSALGDVVNTASRLEGLNKHFNTRVIISGETLSRCDETRVRPLGRIILKGRHEAIDVFELIEEPRWGTSEIARYREAYGLLDAGDLKAEAAFSALAAELPDDGCVALHLERLRAGERGSLVVMTEK